MSYVAKSRFVVGLCGLLLTGAGCAGSSSSGTLSGAGASSATGTGGSSSSGTGGSSSSGTGGSRGTGGSTSAGFGGSGAGLTSGAAGAGPGAGTGGSSGTGALSCAPNAIFCADFENGQIPSGATFYPAYEQSTMSMYMAVDGTMGANGSAHSLKVTPGSNFSQMLGVLTGTATFWTRMYIQSMIDTSTVTGHDAFVAAIDDTANGGKLSDAGDPNNGLAIRVGEHSCQLEINNSVGDAEVLSDAVDGNSNYTCAGGVTFAANTWYCLEVFYDGPNSTVRVFVDGSEVTGLDVTNWGPHNYDLFKFGFENYGGTGRTIWYDDVAIAPAQIGCL
jgi:hypothetical protein